MLRSLLSPLLGLSRSALNTAHDQDVGAYSRYARDLKIDGEWRSVAGLRSAYSRNTVQWLTAVKGEPVRNYDGTQLAAAYLLGTAYLAINGRAGFAAEVPIQVVNQADKPDEASPAQCVIDHAARWVWWATAWKLIVGSYYFWKRPNRNGYYSGLRPVSPLDVVPVTAGNNELAYYMVSDGYRSVQVPPHEMIAFHTFHPFTDLDGASALESAMLRVNIEVNVSRFGEAFFANNARPDVIIQTKAAINEDQRKKLREYIDSVFRGVQNAFKAMILGGAEYTVTPVSYNPVDLALVPLTEQSDAKICAGIGINPALVGLGKTGDPLSAQSTMRELRVGHLQHIAIPDTQEFCNVLNEQWLHPDFDGATTWTLKPDTNAIQSEAAGTGERITSAGSAATAHVWTVNEAREYSGKPADAALLQVNPDWAGMAFKDGGLMHHEYRQALKLKPDPRTVGMYVWELDPQRAQQPPSQFTATFPPNSPPPPTIDRPPEPKALAARSEPVKDALTTIDVQPTRAAGDAYVLLSLANNPDIARIQSEIKLAMQDADALFPVEWEDPATFHVTLVYAPGATNLDTIKNVLPKSINPFTFEVGPLDYFDKPDKAPIILRVQPTLALTALQSGLAGAFLALGLELSGYSEPAQWQPHITLGYMPAGVLELPIWDKRITVTGTTLECSIANGGDQFEIIYVTRSKENEVKQLKELDLWRAKVKRHGGDARFNVEFIPGGVAAFVRSNLADGWNHAAVFGAAKAALRDGTAPVGLGATEDEALSFWKHFDELKHDLGAAWVNYMQRVSDRLYPALIANPSALSDDVFTSEHAALLDAWIGTPDAPGDLSKLLLAGVAAGQAALDRETAANPHVRALVPPIAANILWNLSSVEALSFIKDYAFGLIKNIDITTKDKIRAAVDEYVATGQDADVLRDRIANILVPPGGTVTDAILNRARLIGQTESQQAFTEGCFKRWEDANVTRARRLTVLQSGEHPVCDRCKSMHGQVASFREGWLCPVDGKRYTGAVHPGCRDFFAPVIGEA